MRTQGEGSRLKAQGAGQKQQKKTYSLLVPSTPLLADYYNWSMGLRRKKMTICKFFLDSFNR
jgi:hypothetical protein